MHLLAALLVVFLGFVVVSGRPSGYGEDFVEEEDEGVAVKRGGWNSWGWGPGAAGKRSGPIRRYPVNGALQNLATADPCAAWKYLALNPDAFVRRTELITLAQCLQWKS